MEGQVDGLSEGQQEHCTKTKCCWAAARFPGQDWGKEAGTCQNNQKLQRNKDKEKKTMVIRGALVIFKCTVSDGEG